MKGTSLKKFKEYSFNFSVYDRTISSFALSQREILLEKQLLSIRLRFYVAGSISI